MNSDIRWEFLLWVFALSAFAESTVTSVCYKVFGESFAALPHFLYTNVNPSEGERLQTDLSACGVSQNK